MPTWTNIAKATGTSWTNITKVQSPTTVSQVGVPIGLLLALTYATTTQSGDNLWTNIAKASGTSWTSVSKAT